MGSRSRIDDWLASLEGNPSLQRGDFDRDGQPNYCSAHRNLAHLSDHHPLVVHLNGTSMGIRINKGWEKDTRANRARTKRLKKHMTEDDRKAVKDALEETLKEDIVDVASRIRCIGETGLDVREELEGAASQIHDILKKALTTSLEEVGEDVTYTGMMKPGAGPKRRQIQEGYLREVDKRKHKNLQTTHTKLRAALRKKPKDGEASEAPQIYREMEAEIKCLSQENREGTEGEEQWWETAARALKQARVNIRALYKKHEHRQAWKRIKHFRDLLRGSPKTAHRYLFETGEKHSLEGVRLATGEITTSEEDLLKEVEKHFAKQQRTRVPEGEAKNFPWERKRLKVDSTLIKDVGGSHRRLCDRYNREVYNDALARLPNGKAAGPDEIPNEILKWLPTEFHNMLHEYFLLLWGNSYTPTLWKDAITVLLYKKDDAFNVKNYRPIGLKRTIYKLWTATITRVLTDFVE